MEIEGNKVTSPEILLFVQEALLKELRAFEYTTAYTGVLGHNRQISCVNYGDVTKRIGQIQTEVAKMKRALKLEKQDESIET